ncbi:hypothetical protein R1sor_014838 [Riccia sorocarpa]|uniref:Uncharacterized protein n=1 Tax=Riccia sorocarpa TaxID=122646 RepID=A0ABD3HDE0_9MARC
MTIKGAWGPPALGDMIDCGWLWILHVTVCRGCACCIPYFTSVQLMHLTITLFAKLGRDPKRWTSERVRNHAPKQENRSRLAAGGRNVGCGWREVGRTDFCVDNRTAGTFSYFPASSSAVRGCADHSYDGRRSRIVVGVRSKFSC